MLGMSNGKITYPTFNNGKPTTLYFNFSLDEAKMQFGEIFVEGYYKKGLIKKDMVVVDIGAAMGLSALYFKDHAKMVYALEPVKEIYESAVKNTKDYKNIKCFPIGIAAITKDGLLYGYDNAPASTIEKRDNITSTAKVKFLSINDFFEQNKIDHVDLLKVDCEGSEYEIFCSDGFAKVASKIDYIIGEAHWQPPLYPGFIPDMLKENGFETEWLPFENIYREITYRLANGKEKKYSFKVKSMFFAKRVDI